MTMTTNTNHTYRQIKHIAADERVTEIAIWQLIRQGKVNSEVVNGKVVIRADVWNAYADSPAGWSYLNDRRRLGRDYYAERAKNNAVEE